jgi:ArsR family transcriptional regulator
VSIGPGIKKWLYLYIRLKEYTSARMSGPSTVQIYRSFGDETRRRICHLLTRGPLCVCHFQEILGETQVKISKHLAALRADAMVTARRHQNWMIYSLPPKPGSAFSAHLECLQKCAETDTVLKRDTAKLKALLKKGGLSPACPSCPSPTSTK